MKERPPVLNDQQLDGIHVGAEEVEDVIKSNCFDKTGKSAIVQRVTAVTIVFNRKVAKAQRDADVAWCEQAKADVAREIFEDIVCPLCYRVNPHHAQENKGKGCNWCQEKEDYTGQTMEQALLTLEPATPNN